MSLRLAAALISTLALSGPAAAQALGTDLDGTWRGSLDGALEVAFVIKTETGKSTVTLTLLDQADGIPVSAAIRDDGRVRFEVKDISGGFEGALTSDHDALQGTWTQAGKRVPLSLRRAK